MLLESNVRNEWVSLGIVYFTFLSIYIFLPFNANPLCVSEENTQQWISMIHWMKSRFLVLFFVCLFPCLEVLSKDFAGRFNSSSSFFMREGRRRCHQGWSQGEMELHFPLVSSLSLIYFLEKRLNSFCRDDQKNHLFSSSSPSTSLWLCKSLFSCYDWREECVLIYTPSFLLFQSFTHPLLLHILHESSEGRKELQGNCTSFSSLILPFP